MPYIEVKTNLKLSGERAGEAKVLITKALEDSFPGKTEKWLMLDFEGERHMYLAGSGEPCVIVNVALFGKGSDKSYDKMTAEVCRIMESVLGIPAERVYVKYEEVAHWGWNGNNF